ncbi:MAG: deoxyribose-phosphate aldolase [Eubacterium sp.]|jgi:deoxyribose-phosphate aldolase|nr:deoxyribose-phosphate aldolase [Eubacterium sp.]
MKEYRKDVLTIKDIAYMMDPSILKLDTSYEDLDDLIAACKKYDFGCAFAWPGYYEEMSHRLREETKTAFGTSLGFPSGQEATKTKVQQAEFFMTMDPAEVDMVMNVGWLISKRYKQVEDDISAVRKATIGSSLKVIIEAMLLNDDQITEACKIVMSAGADYVKTGTGFSSAPTTAHHVEHIRKTVGPDYKVKVAGGVRSLDTLLRMYKLGADRFGIGLPSALKIIEEAKRLPNGQISMLEIDLSSDEHDVPANGGY